ncbi:MAG: PqqD family protein [Armatimonadetes bacterium]|nr:PqqD family protein [Armatimonadota bacterium]
MGSLYTIAAQYLPFIRKKPALSRQQALKTRPIRNPLVEWTKDELGEVSLFIPRRKDRIARILCWLFRAPEKREIVLGEVGGFVWELCDGEHSVDSIVSAITSRYKITRREAEASVGVYLKMLADRKLLGFRVGGSGKKNEQTSRK